MEEHESLPREVLESILELGRISLVFGRIQRVTLHEDGVTPESDTDHTVMLGLIACAFAQQFAPELDLGKIAQFALVHDLVEVYAGDTPTVHIQSNEEAQAKEEREAAALTRLKEQFGTTLPWITETIDAYEQRTTPEARYVKFIDKVLPKITHGLNNGAALAAFDMDQQAMDTKLQHQYESIVSSYGHDQHTTARLYATLARYVKESVFGENPNSRELQ